MLYQPHQSRFQYGHPLTRPYFPPPKYQYNSAFRNTAASIRPTKQLQSTGSRYSKPFKVQPQRQYFPYYYPRHTHYRDWSRKLVEASAYARKLQASRKQKLLQNKKSNPASAGIKLFVAGVNPNGNVLGQWIGQGKVNKPSQQNIAAKLPNTQFPVSASPMEQPVSIVNMNSGLPSGTPFAPKPNPQLQTSQPLQNTKTNVMSSTPNSVGAVIGDINTNLHSQPQANPFLDKESTTKLNSNGAIFSDSLGGAALGPNAHSLLQPTVAQQTSQSGNHGSVQGSQIESKQPNANSAPLNSGYDTNTGSPSNDNIPRQGQAKNVPSSNDQHPPINKVPGNMRGNSALVPLRNTAPPLPVRVPPSQMKAAYKPVTGAVTGASQASLSTMTPAMKNIMQPPKGLALYSTNIDKSTAQKLNVGLMSTSTSRPTSRQIVVTQPSTYNKNSGSRNSLPGNTNRDQTQLDRELALKNILFPPPARNHVDGTTAHVASNPFQKQQPQQFSQPGQVDNMIPSFPAFRYNANLPATGQTSFNSYQRNNIPHFPSADRKKKSIVPQHNSVPYKSSFPLMLHKISPYFKMKRNLKQMASEQAKARRRFLELQRKLA